jgi:serine/threonine-protein kinase HipA
MRLQRAEPIAVGLSARLDALHELGLKRFADLVAGNIRSLMTAFAMKIPDEAQTRDVFMPRAGGWLLS